MGPREKVPARQRVEEEGRQQAVEASTAPPPPPPPPRTAWTRRAGRAWPEQGGERQRLSAGSRLPIPAPRQTLPRGTQGHAGGLGGHSQLLVEPGLATGLEVADDDAELPDVLHELLQVLLQVVKLLRHGFVARTAAGVVRLRRFLLPPGVSTTSVSSWGQWAGPGWRGGMGRGLGGAEPGA